MDIDHCQRLAVGINELYEGRQYCDVRLIASDGIVSAHRVILAVSSPRIRNRVVSSDVIKELKKFSQDAIQIVVNYCYTGQLNIEEDASVDDLMEIFHISCRLEISQIIPVILEKMRLFDWSDDNLSVDSLAAAFMNMNEYESDLSAILNAKYSSVDTCYQFLVDSEVLVNDDEHAFLAKLVNNDNLHNWLPALYKSCLVYYPRISTAICNCKLFNKFQWDRCEEQVLLDVIRQHVFPLRQELMPILYKSYYPRTVESTPEDAINDIAELVDFCHRDTCIVDFCLTSMLSVHFEDVFDALPSVSSDEVRDMHKTSMSLEEYWKMKRLEEKAAKGLRRGRKPKTVRPEQATPIPEATAPDTNDCPVKDTIERIIQTISEQLDGFPKRTRGRPKRQSVKSYYDLTEDTSFEVKRKRGRPKTEKRDVADESFSPKQKLAHRSSSTDNNSFVLHLPPLTDLLKQAFAKEDVSTFQNNVFNAFVEYNFLSRVQDDTFNVVAHLMKDSMTVQTVISALYRFFEHANSVLEKPHCYCALLQHFAINDSELLADGVVNEIIKRQGFLFSHFDSSRPQIQQDITEDSEENEAKVAFDFEKELEAMVETVATSEMDFSIDACVVNAFGLANRDELRAFMSVDADEIHQQLPRFGGLKQKDMPRLIYDDNVLVTRVTRRSKHAYEHRQEDDEDKDYDNMTYDDGRVPVVFLTTLEAPPPIVVPDITSVDEATEFLAKHSFLQCHSEDDLSLLETVSKHLTVGNVENWILAIREAILNVSQHEEDATASSGSNNQSTAVCYCRLFEAMHLDKSTDYITIRGIMQHVIEEHSPSLMNCYRTASTTRRDELEAAEKAPVKSSPPREDTLFDMDEDYKDKESEDVKEDEENINEEVKCTLLSLLDAVESTKAYPHDHCLVKAISKVFGAFYEVWIDFADMTSTQIEQAHDAAEQFGSLTAAVDTTLGSSTDGNFADRGDANYFNDSDDDVPLDLTKSYGNRRRGNAAVASSLASTSTGGGKRRGRPPKHRGSSASTQQTSKLSYYMRKKMEKMELERKRSAAQLAANSGKKNVRLSKYMVEKWGVEEATRRLNNRYSNKSTTGSQSKVTGRQQQQKTRQPLTLESSDNEPANDDDDDEDSQQSDDDSDDVVEEESSSLVSEEVDDSDFEPPMNKKSKKSSTDLPQRGRSRTSAAVDTSTPKSRGRPRKDGTPARMRSSSSNATQQQTSKQRRSSSVRPPTLPQLRRPLATGRDLTNYPKGVPLPENRCRPCHLRFSRPVDILRHDVAAGHRGFVAVCWICMTGPGRPSNKQQSGGAASVFEPFTSDLAFVDHLVEQKDSHLSGHGDGGLSRLDVDIKDVMNRMKEGSYPKYIDDHVQTMLVLRKSYAYRCWLCLSERRCSSIDAKFNSGSRGVFHTRNDLLNHLDDEHRFSSAPKAGAKSSPKVESYNHSQWRTTARTKALNLSTSSGRRSGRGDVSMSPSASPPPFPSPKRSVPCAECSEAFSSDVSRAVHVASVHPAAVTGPSALFVCWKCPADSDTAKYQTFNQLMRHFLVNSSDHFPRTDDDVGGGVGDTTDRVLFHCDEEMCETRSTSLSAYLQHIMATHQRHNVSPWRCSICCDNSGTENDGVQVMFSADSAEALVAHLKLHEEKEIRDRQPKRPNVIVNGSGKGLKQDGRRGRGRPPLRQQKCNGSSTASPRHKSRDSRGVNNDNDDGEMDGTLYREENTCETCQNCTPLQLTAHRF